MLTRLLATRLGPELIKHSRSNGALEDCASRSLFQQLSRTDCLYRASILLRTLRRGQHLFRPLDRRAYVYSICRGALKTYRSLHDYSERICAFHFTDDLLGLDTLFGRPLRRGAIALTASTVYMIPVTMLVEHIGRCEVTRSELLARFYDEIVGLEEHQSLNKLNAEERLAAFFLWVIDQLVPEGAKCAVSLPMSQKDIGNYLGLAPETVSRILARFEERGLLSVNRRELKVQNLHQLRAIAGGRDSRRVEGSWEPELDALGA